MMESDPKIIELRADDWKEPLDIYESLLHALGAPRWHGRNINALIDSMVYGGINEIDPPYMIIVRGHERAPPDVLRDLTFMILALGEAAAEGGRSDIEFEVRPRFRIVT